ncbi:2-phosphoglycerate kinase [Gracilibacillus oryzae]|uniref:2-phosphoglycerate kinase n=1 Tax=Gracilibacillus oryzae TaxID=1672701 RepID=A0A7C8KPB9_9BACI|nr:2-phosphoglycerate kinase [Gracilibacillus oryzae]KAB8130735.1 2-phosphoglycerate kinase [Gracilibacillus oryzae]
MIILIGGVSCTGKTNMAQKLLEKYHVPYYSIDHLKMGIYRSDKNCGFTPEDSEEKIAEKLWPIVREMIKTMIENQQHAVIEGCYMLPEQVESLRKIYPDDIVSLYLLFSADYIEQHFASHIVPYRNIIEKRGEEERPISQFIAEHAELRNNCIAHSANFFEITQDYAQEIKKAYAYIEEKVLLNEKTNNKRA